MSLSYIGDTPGLTYFGIMVSWDFQANSDFGGVRDSLLVCKQASPRKAFALVLLAWNYVENCCYCHAAQARSRVAPDIVTELTSIGMLYFKSF